MINEELQNIILASICSSIFTLILIASRKTIIRLAGAAWNYYLWIIIFLPWIIVFPPSISFLDHANVLLFMDNTDLKKTLSEPHSHYFNAINWIKYIWISGVCLLASFIFIQDYLFLKKIKTHSRQLNFLEERNINLLLTINKKYVNRIYLSNLISSPLTGHFVRSKIYLPANFFDCYSTEEQKYVLQHEIIHCQRFDLLANALMLIFNCINWFNPILFLAYEHFKNAQEVACDERLCRHFSLAEKKKYGLALLKTTDRQAQLDSSLACSLTTGMQLKDRFLVLKFHGIKNNIFCAISIILCAMTFSIAVLKINNYFIKNFISPIQFYSENKYPKNNGEYLYKENWLILPNHVEIWASQIILSHAKQSDKKISKLTINSPGVIIKNNKIIHFQYGVFDPNTLQFSGAIQQ